MLLRYMIRSSGVLPHSEVAARLSGASHSTCTQRVKLTPDKAIQLPFAPETHIYEHTHTHTYSHKRDYFAGNLIFGFHPARPPDFGRAGPDLLKWRPKQLHQQNMGLFRASSDNISAPEDTIG